MANHPNIVVVIGPWYIQSFPDLNDNNIFKTTDDWLELITTDHERILRELEVYKTQDLIKDHQYYDTTGFYAPRVTYDFLNRQVIYVFEPIGEGNGVWFTVSKSLVKKS